MALRKLLGAVPAWELDQLDDSASRGFHLAGHSVFVVKQRNALFAYINSCPHLGIELEWMPDQFLDHARQFIHCATHGALFLIHSGECISGPCQGQSLQRLEMERTSDEWRFYLLS
ncbi:Rieske (2Fe-2S) protein [Hahella aquimaris]|uniref:Rieske (2Fe-2S) protein n=1 Tax=Hahella sp. HNIBRBA332 TaxID=3015983 RepID=UPI00273C7A67|nr:Rieske (2Fe-2S) protein [Hahella sp. HNIBRBA332]WLQ13759.1 Rieske (2Fe-2S) protein [Hahella sp. HNIBRBA332]